MRAAQTVAGPGFKAFSLRPRPPVRPDAPGRRVDVERVRLVELGHQRVGIVAALRGEEAAQDAGDPFGRVRGVGDGGVGGGARLVRSGRPGGSTAAGAGGREKSPRGPERPRGVRLADSCPTVRGPYSAARPGRMSRHRSAGRCGWRGGRAGRAIEGRGDLGERADERVRVRAVPGHDEVAEWHAGQRDRRQAVG